LHQFRRVCRQHRDGYSPEGTALQLVLKTINSAQQEIRLMGYSFTSPEVAGALVRAKQRGLDVKVVLTGKPIQAGKTRRVWRP
jgi:phosphatidylserine/phosphatidylglycerophosphate/cardiolipin synthase-like enzyme